METDQKKARRDKIATSLILGAAFLIAALSLIFGLTQSIEANRNLEKAVAAEKVALSAKLEADRQRDLANEQTALLLRREQELEKINEEVQKMLADCRKKK